MAQVWIARSVFGLFATAWLAVAVGWILERGLGFGNCLWLLLGICLMSGMIFSCIPAKCSKCGSRKTSVKVLKRDVPWQSFSGLAKLPGWQLCRGGVSAYYDLYETKCRNCGHSHKEWKGWTPA